MNYYTKQTPLGEITIAEKNDVIAFLYYGVKQFSGSYICSELLQLAFIQLQEYLSGQRTQFSLPLNSTGSTFQKKVWRQIMQIPYANTTTYKEVAKAIGNQYACRAVGTACHKNNIPIFIPCHRVTASNGDIGGYIAGCDIKSHLLQIEKFSSY